MHNKYTLYIPHAFNIHYPLLVYTIYTVYMYKVSILDIHRHYLLKNDRVYPVYSVCSTYCSVYSEYSPIYSKERQSIFCIHFIHIHCVYSLYIYTIIQNRHLEGNLPEYTE